MKSVSCNPDSWDVVSELSIEAPMSVNCAHVMDAEERSYDKMRLHIIFDGGEETFKQFNVIL